MTGWSTDLVLDAFGGPRIQIQAGGCVGGCDDARQCHVLAVLVPAVRQAPPREALQHRRTLFEPSTPMHVAVQATSEHAEHHITDQGNGVQLSCCMPKKRLEP